MKYRIGGSPAREVVRQFMDDWADYPDKVIAEKVMWAHEEPWMSQKTLSLKGDDTILLHMIRSIRAQ